MAHISLMLLVCFTFKKTIFLHGRHIEEPLVCFQIVFFKEPNGTVLELKIRECLHC